MGSNPFGKGDYEERDEAERPDQKSGHGDVVGQTELRPPDRNTGIRDEVMLEEFSDNEATGLALMLYFQHILPELRGSRHLFDRLIALGQGEHGVDHRLDLMFLNECEHTGEVLW